MAAVQYEASYEGPEHIFAIALDSGEILKIEPDEDVATAEQTTRGWEVGLKSGEDTIRIVASKKKDGKVKIRNKPTKTTEIKGRNRERKTKSVIEPENRRLAVGGTKTTLVLRAIDAIGVSTSASESVLSDEVFGTGEDPVNLKSQYEACSYNQVTFEAATSSTQSGTLTTPGVYTVNIENTVSGSERGSIESAMVAEGNNMLGKMHSQYDSQYDHVMLCIPPGTNGGWIGYGYYNWYLTVFNDNWCKYVSIQMHELGHNFDLAHSGENGEQYDDASGMMGYSYDDDDIPLMCFNAAKNFQLGWYTNGHKELQGAAKIWSGKLFGIVDYKGPDYVYPANEAIIIRSHGSPDDYYVSFNRGAEFNSGTLEGRDQVLVHKRATGVSREKSWLVAKLSESQKHIIPGM